MVQILLGAEKQAKASESWPTAFSHASTSPLTPPPTCPTITVTDVPYMVTQEETNMDELLSDLFSKSGFNLAAGIMDGGCYIDSYFKFNCHAIGARVDLLHRRCNAGWYLLGLLNRCPIRLWTPVDVFDYAKEMFKIDFKKCTSDWLWEPHAPFESHKKFKHLLPKNLLKLCLDVEKVLDESDSYIDVGEYPDIMEEQHYELPAIILTWWDNIHWYNGQCLNNPTFTAEHGTNPTFAIMDSYAETTMQTGGTHMGSPIYHNLDDVSRIVKLAEPFAKLIKYLSHNDEECSFSCF